jgi:hypothetical protein
MNPAIRRRVLIALLACCICPMLAWGQETQSSLHDEAMTLFQSLDAEQRNRATRPFDDPDREQELFPGGPRAGIQLRELSEEQRELAMKLIQSFTSEYGAKKCEQIAAQGPQGLARYYLCFFGEPRENGNYAWRVAEHHLTLVHVEVEDGQPARFGPILLGADPPVLWDDEEDAIIALYAAMTPQERQLAHRRGRGISSVPLDGGGVRVGDLNPEARQRAADVFSGRLKFFSPEIQHRIEQIVKEKGGLEAMQLVFFGEATRRSADGGKWDFKLGSAGFLCDYENTRGHIHMSMKGSLAQEQK